MRFPPRMCEKIPDSQHLSIRIINHLCPTRHKCPAIFFQVPAGDKPNSKAYHRDRNLAEDRSTNENDIPLNGFTTEMPSATATIKPPTTTLDDVFISVKTTKNYHGKRLPVILKTWFQLAKKQVSLIGLASDWIREKSLKSN